VSETNKQKHYEAIDGLRAFSAIGIVLMHVLANGNYNLDGFVFKKLIPSFTNLVFLFMIISGFAMCCG
jgi:peptidoglycan/LPS O-acetylase OafA/YrhL